MTQTSVILSGVEGSRSEPATEAKDPDAFACEKNPQGVLPKSPGSANFPGTGMEVCMKDHEYFVYIVCSRSGTLYIGMTNSIYRRALQHKRGDIEGFARMYHCDRLVYYESFDDVHKAIGREKQLKGWRQSRKIALIEWKNPRWADLAETWGAQMAFAGESIRTR